MKTVKLYKKASNKIPFLLWQNNLDKTLRNKIDQKIIKLQKGNYSDCSILKDSGGVKEARIKTASGIRIYFAEEEEYIILLLVGGDKDTQTKDIDKAKEYWEDYKQRR